MPDELPDDLTPKRVAELQAAGEIELVDIREPDERDAGHVAGSRHIEFARLSQAAGSLDREKPLVLYCRMGGRSSVALQAFKASGFDVHHMQGGLLAWADEGLPLEPEDGSVAEH
jgi:rhodanese-related sulfurtransferase